MEAGAAGHGAMHPVFQTFRPAAMHPPPRVLALLANWGALQRARTGAVGASSQHRPAGRHHAWAQCKFAAPRDPTTHIVHQSVESEPTQTPREE